MKDHPNTLEMQNAFDDINQALTIIHDSNNNESSFNSINCKFFFIQGQGGSGKSTFAKKLMALARSKGLIALGCASTALAAAGNF